MANPTVPAAPPTVVLVDCYANSKTFIGDTGFGLLADQLMAQGFRSHVIELVRDDPPCGGSTDDVLALLAEMKPGFVVVSRAWNGELVTALRRATPDSVFVRYSRGAPSAVDSSLDAVADADGIRRLVAGEEGIEAPHWKRTRGEMAAARPERSARPAPHPAISGPARGCPFLVDVRSSPAFRDADIDFDSVQSKGCSFCLDNVGAFSSFEPDVVVDTWLSQARTIRARQPEVREILLTDERPHANLPAFFRAIAREPDLRGIELLIKTRVDWLEEYADTALREACEIAEESDSVLHIYLVGFESFHQSDLDLFNKSVTVADNLRAIEVLKELERNHPRSFEFRRLRAHGIVLFHPWTTTESLLENARIMRDVAFHELRSQALRTRLRLYESVPLHALAVRDGLLADEFSAGREDRAVEQGYDASIPWRFADPRIEAIFRAANELAAAQPELLDADALEIATHFVLRWPCFSTRPELTALPIAQAILSWGSSGADVLAVTGSAVAGFDKEVEPVAAGEKDACLKEGVARQDAERLVSAYRLMGLAAAVVSQHNRGGDDGRHRPGREHCCVAVARDAATLERTIKEQQAVEAGNADRIAAMGALMGYPACCVDAFAGNRTHGDNLALEFAPFEAHPDRILAPTVNRFGAVSLISHMLCAPDCQPSQRLAEARLQRLREIDAPAAERISAHLKQAFLRLDYRRGCALQGQWEDCRYVVRSLRPFRSTDFGVPPDTVRSIRLRRGGVVFSLAGGGEHHIDGPSPVLVEPGQRLAATVLDSLRDSAPETANEPSETTSSSRSADDLCHHLRSGLKVGDHSIAAVEEEGSGAIVRLSNQGSEINVRIQMWQPSLSALSRRGRWAFDLEPPRQPSETERRAIGALARVLPAGHTRENDGGSANGDDGEAAPGRSEVRKQTDGVVCTAPWTTLEVIDPDGLVRQCCADWTNGNRGNLHHHSLLEIWNGQGYRSARAIMAGASPGELCKEICPRLYDRQFGESMFRIIPGADTFERNQRLILDDIAERRDVVRGNPLYVAICPSTYCNYDCIMCLHGRTPRRELSEDVWDQLSSMLPTMRVLTLLGGEPLANPAAMKFLRGWDRRIYPDAAVSLVTNGSLLSSQVLRHLEHCAFGSVTISLNAGDAPTYDRVQRGIGLADVLDNLDSLIDFRRSQVSDFPIVLSFVVQPANHESLIAFGEIALRRDLPIRLMPLSIEGVEELDYYDDPDQVARVLASMDAMIAWAERSAPQFKAEIQATRAATAQVAQRRHNRHEDKPATAIS